MTGVQTCALPICFPVTILEVCEYSMDGEVVVDGSGMPKTRKVEATLNGLGNFLGLCGDIELMEYAYRRAGWWNRGLQMGIAGVKERVEGLWLQGKNVKEWMGNMGWRVGANGEDTVSRVGSNKGSGGIREIRISDETRERLMLEFKAGI